MSTVGALVMSALLLTGGVSAFLLATDAPHGPVYLPAGAEGDSGAAAACSDVGDYHHRFEPDGNEVILGLSSRSLTHEFNLTRECVLDVWASWARPYASIRLTLSNETDALVQYHEDVDAPGDIARGIVLEPGLYEVRFSVFGAHALHAFETGGVFRQPA